MRKLKKPQICDFKKIENKLNKSVTATLTFLANQCVIIAEYGKQKLLNAD